MRIGIITIHDAPNYGACLQSYALWKYLSDCGWDCELIDLRRPGHHDFVFDKRHMEYRVFTKRKLKKRFKRILVKIGLYKQKRYLTIEAERKFKAFNGLIKMSCPYTRIASLYKKTPIYDIYITGSDQVWNPTQPYCLEPYFLTFAPKDKRRLSYASSIGITKLTSKEKQDFALWLRQYDAVSVREKQAKNLLEAITGIPITQVADPTFLLDRGHWRSLAVSPMVKAPYMLLFTLAYNRDLLDYAIGIGKQSGKHVLYLTAVQPEPDNSDYTAITDAGPREWLGYIGGASMVITDSFHGTVFSIIMGVDNFFTYIASANRRGSRITDLLDTFGLSDHLLLQDLSDTYGSLNSRNINHVHVETIINEEMRNGRIFLDRNII